GGEARRRASHVRRQGRRRGQAVRLGHGGRRPAQARGARDPRGQAQGGPPRADPRAGRLPSRDQGPPRRPARDPGERGEGVATSKTEQTDVRGAMSSSRGRGAGGGGRPAKRPVVHAQAALQLVTEALLDRKAVDPLVLDLRGLSAATDYFVIVSGTSDAHVRGTAVALAGATPLAAQYFGQNKVQYRNFAFQIIQTDHFEVYYYPAERVAALDAARLAERWYGRLSRILHHEFQGRKPIILYASQSDFQQTNAISGDIGEGTGGVTEFFKHRMVLPFTGSYAELEHVIGHEMVHQFQYDVFSRGRIGAGVQTLVNVNPPLWFMEGMAEYLSIGPIDPHTSMWLRDAALEGHLPTIEQLTYDPRIFPYRFGHALWA